MTIQEEKIEPINNICLYLKFNIQSLSYIQIKGIISISKDILGKKTSLNECVAFNNATFLKERNKGIIMSHSMISDLKNIE